MPEEPKQSTQQPISSAIFTSQTPVTYVNNLAVSLSASDLQLTLVVNNRHVGNLVMSHSVAKSLYNSIGKALSDFENKTGTKIADLAFINESLRK